MAVSYPGISYLRGYEPKDPLEQFAKGFGFGEGIRNEAGAKDALSQFIDSLTGGQAQAPAGSQRNVVDQSIASARAVQPPAGLTAAMDANYKPGDAAGRAMQFFMSKGYSQPQAAGIVGNLMQESGLNVGAINPGDGRDGSDSIGIAQWNGPRAQALRAYATQNGLDLNDLDTQFGFIDHELRSTEQGAYNRLMQAQDPIQAAAAFVGYERPQGWTAENPYNSHGWGNRARHAAQLAGGTYDAGAPVQLDPGTGLPDRDVMRALVANPLTRDFALALAETAHKERAAGRDPMRSLQMQKLQAEIETMRNPQAKPTALMQNLEAAGLQPGSAEYRKAILDGTKGGVTVNTGGGQSQLASELGKGLASDALKQREDATAAASVISVINEGRALLDQGAITGALADWKIGALKLASSLGLNVPQDAVNNSESFRATMGSAVAQIIKQFGAGTGLSDADREYAANIAGGNIELNEAAIRQIFDIADRAARGKIRAWEERVPALIDGDIPSALAVPMPDEYSATPTVNTQEEFDALPSGAVFIDSEDGRTYRKP